MIDANFCNSRPDQLFHALLKGYAFIGEGSSYKVVLVSETLTSPLLMERFQLIPHILHLFVG